MNQTSVVEKLNKLEKEILKIKKGAFSFSQKPISLKGILKGAKITEKDIEKAKKSLFKTVRI